MEIMSEGSVGRLLIPANYVGCLSANQMTGTFLLPAPQCTSALCAVRKVYFSAQPNNLKLILNFDKYYPIEHIFVPACSSARKIHFFKF